jgi:hypothetical protein
MYIQMAKCTLFLIRIVTNLIPKMDRGFFLNDNDYVCYRRNYFQLSASYSLEREDSLTVILDGRQVDVINFNVAIHARVDSGNKEIGLVQHTAKRDKGPQLTPSPKTLQPGGDPFAYMDENNHNRVATFERIQFKSATANNGKRRAAQQFFYVIVELNALTEKGEVLIGQSQSVPLIVRGRSPSHYTDENVHSAVSMNSQTSPFPKTDSPFPSPYRFPTPDRFSPYPSNEFNNNIGSWIRTRDNSGASFETNDSFDNFDSNEYAPNSFSPIPNIESFSPIPNIGSNETESQFEDQKYYGNNYITRLPTPSSSYHVKSPMSPELNQLPALRPYISSDLSNHYQPSVPYQMHSELQTPYQQTSVETVYSLPPLEGIADFHFTDYNPDNALTSPSFQEYSYVDQPYTSLDEPAQGGV